MVRLEKLLRRGKNHITMQLSCYLAYAQVSINAVMVKSLAHCL